jgi:hypothetical protein
MNTDMRFYTVDRKHFFVGGMETEPVTMGGDPARGDPLPLSRAQTKEGRKEGRKKNKATTRDEELLRRETQQQLQRWLPLFALSHYPLLLCLAPISPESRASVRGAAKF